jgi:hypothetical protein
LTVVGTEPGTINGTNGDGVPIGTPSNDDMNGEAGSMS